MSPQLHRSFALHLVAVVGIGIATPLVAHAHQSQTQSDVPKEFRNKLPDPTYVTRTVMIPMRDGVKLKTFIILPRGATNAPIVLPRTPYQAGARADFLLQAGYIRVDQDVRGKYGSEGEYVMTRPVRGPLNPTSTDHTTDAWDTVDWLVKNTPESNGRAG